MIKSCKIHGLTDHASRRDRQSRCRKCEYTAMSKRRYKIKANLIALHGSKCKRCGYDRCLKALSFHHRDRTQKSFAMCGKSVIAYKRLVEESMKCDLLCMNCHMEVEDEIFKSKVSSVAEQSLDKALAGGSSPSPSTTYRPSPAYTFTDGMGWEQHIPEGYHDMGH